MEATTGYVRLGEDRIAYQVVGGGPIDLVITPGSFLSFDVAGEDPAADLYFRRLASFTRLIRFDRRGAGASDPVALDALPHLESYVEETVAVMDAVGSHQAAIMAGYDAGPMAMLLAATKPERISALVLSNTTARPLKAADYPIGLDPDAAEQFAEMVAETWGTGEQAALFVPSRADDPRFLAWFAKLQRLTISPTEAGAYLRAMFDVDVRSVLPSIRIPTLILHRTELAYIPFSHAEYVADHIPGARLVAIPGRDGPFIWEHPERALDAIEEFLTGVSPMARPDRVIATVLFTDIVGSTELAADMGDRAWRDLLESHDAAVRSELEAYRGRVIGTQGDGFLATFDGPGRAIRAALGIGKALSFLGLEVRCGLHTGEIEIVGDDVAGLAVHIGARIVALAPPGDVLVSRTVKDLVVGSGIEFEDRGTHSLKGVPDEWQLFAAT